MVRVVSENTDADIAKRRALEDLGRELRDLTANLIRVVRGAGRSEAIAGQINKLVGAMIAYRDAAGFMPSAEELDGMLSIRDEDIGRRLSGDHLSEHYAERTVIRGALQIAASQLGQRTQETAGNSEMFDGINRIGQLRDAERLRWAATTRVPRKPAAKRKARTKVAPKK